MQLSNTPIEVTVTLSVMPDEHKQAFQVLADLYGDDTETLIHGLMDMTVRAAILAGVSNVNFAKGMKAHWDEYADLMNRAEN